MFKAEINEDMNLKKDVQYTIKYDTKLEPNQWHKHIKGDIIVHTALDRDITIPFDKEVTPI